MILTASKNNQHINIHLSFFPASGIFEFPMRKIICLTSMSDLYHNNQNLWRRFYGLMKNLEVQKCCFGTVPWMSKSTLTDPFHEYQQGQAEPSRRFRGYKEYTIGSEHLYTTHWESEPITWQKILTRIWQHFSHLLSIQTKKISCPMGWIGLAI